MVYGITITEFARRQGVTRAAVYQWLDACPDVRPTKLGGVSLLSPEDCQRLLNRPRKKMGRPRKCLTTRRA